MMSQCVCYIRVLIAFCVFLVIESQCMCFTRVSVSFKTPFAFCLVWRHNTRVSHACLQTLFTFSSVLLHNVCVSHASLRHLSRVLLSIASQCMCLKCVFASVKMPFVFFFQGHNACVSHASLHQLSHRLRFSRYSVTMHVFRTPLCIV